MVQEKAQPQSLSPIRITEEIKKHLMKYGYPERTWVPCGKHKGRAMWCSRITTDDEWRERLSKVEVLYNMYSLGENV